MKANLFIWGIRKGFERAGIYNSYSDNPSGLESVPGDVRAVDLIQFDAFRPAFITKTAGTSSFMVHRTEQHTIVSYIYTNIKEFATGDRDGYVVFSMIIPKNYSFENSPREVLHNLAEFYKSRAEKSTQNNFVKEEIDDFLANVTLKANNTSRIQSNHFYNFQNTQELDCILKCDLAYFSFEELILIDKSIDFVTLDLEKKLRANPEIQGHSFQKANYASRKLEFENEQVKKKQDREREVQLKAEAEKASSSILLALRNNKNEDALNLYEQFTHKSLLDGQIKRKIDDIKVGKKQETTHSKTKDRDLKYSKEIIRRLDKGDAKGALPFYKELSDKTILPKEYHDKIYKYQNQKEGEERNRLGLAAEKRRKKRKLIIILSSSGAFLVIAFILPYIFILNGNPEEVVKEEAPVEVIPNAPDSAEVLLKKQCDSLGNGDSVFVGHVQNNTLLDSAVVKYSDEGWEYHAKGGDAGWKPVKIEASIKFLNDKFFHLQKNISEPDSLNIKASKRPTESVSPKPSKIEDPCDGYVDCKAKQEELSRGISEENYVKNQSLYKDYDKIRLKLKKNKCEKINASFKSAHKKIAEKYTG